MEAWDNWSPLRADEFELCETIEIPLLGVVAAGEPYRAFPLDETLSVPTTLWGGKQVFALRVRGSSMVDEGIHNGDYLIVEPRAVAENGQTVVAEIDGCVTVKKYFREADGQVRLQPANPEMLPLVVRGEHMRIIGVVAGIVRKFGFSDRERVPTAPVKRTIAKPQPAPPLDAAVIDVAVNVIDRQLARWNAALEHAKEDRRLRRHVTEMSELGRDLQTLRDWCARTHKPSLRRALIVDANKVMHRMRRFATVTPVELADLVLH